MSSRMVFKWTFAVWALLSATVAAAQEATQIIQGTEVEEFLARANISGMKDIPEGVTLPKKASLELNGVKHFAVWKTIDQGPVMQKQLDRGVELQFQDSWRTEVAAYELDKLIGLGMGSCYRPAYIRWNTGLAAVLGRLCNGRKTTIKEETPPAQPN